MMKQHLNGWDAALRGSLAAVTLIAGGFTVVGCADLEEPATPEGGQIAVTELAPRASMQSEIRVERSPSGDALRIVSPGWRETAHNVWQSDNAGLLVIDTTQPAAGDRASPLALSCTISVYTGPIGSSPTVLGLFLQGPGAVGFAQADCTGGVGRFTVTARACTDQACHSTANFTIQGPPGMGEPGGVASYIFGAAGLNCTAWTAVSPAGINQSKSFLCG